MQGPGLLSEASLTSSFLCPEVPARTVIDSCRPQGRQAGRGAFWDSGRGCWGFKGRWEVAILSSA